MPMTTCCSKAMCPKSIPWLSAADIIKRAPGQLNSPPLPHPDALVNLVLVLCNFLTIGGGLVRASPFGARCAPWMAMVVALATTLAALAGGAVDAAEAAETLKLAVGAPGNWDTCIPAVGERAGIFRKHGIELELLYTNGGGETMQAVISGGVDIGIAAGTGAVMGAFAKGAPVRIIAAGVTGASDLYWYVPAASPIRSLKDAAGKTVAFSTNGASTHVTLIALLKHFDVKARPVATGAAAVTFTQAMSGQVDIGGASPPFGLDALDDGRIRLVARGSDAPETAGQTGGGPIVKCRGLFAR